MVVNVDATPFAPAQGVGAIALHTSSSSSTASDVLIEGLATSLRKERQIMLRRRMLHGIAILLLSLMMASCNEGSVGQRAGDTVGGAAMGAGVGALIGAGRDYNNRGRDAASGALIGAGLGAVIGSIR
jgi:hypothetical protein